MKIPLLNNGDLLVDDSFLHSESPPSKEKEAEKYITYSGEGEVPDIDGLIDKLNGIKGKLAGNNRAGIDGRAAELIHRSLRLSRNQANDSRFWHYLTVLKCPDYVVWRHFDKGKVYKQRYLGRWTRNALGRLWWWAEFTHDSDDGKNPYSRTVRAASSQEFMLHTVDDLFSGNSYLVQALCDYLIPSDTARYPDADIRKLMVRLNALLVTVAIDTLDRNEIRPLVAGMVIQLSDSGGSKKRKRGIFSKIFR